MRILFILLACTSVLAQADLETVFEKGNGNQSATYQETIAFYKMLAGRFPTVTIRQMGLTDSGEPLHLVLFDPSSSFKPDGRAVILVNNGIHAGEPDGIDASMMLVRDLASGKVKAPGNVLLAVIPVYNIGGALNRNATSRVNQEGPEQYGFRGNARNYDLNRDFIKADARNTRSFYRIFHELDPDVFIDNHVSNGADYQYVLTYIITQPDKLGPVLGPYLSQNMMPALVSDLKRKKIESTPYVNAWGTTPDKGFAQFFESPRYATGYTALFNTIGFVVETHMLKPYPDRVRATYEFMASALAYTAKEAAVIKARRKENASHFASAKNYALGWKIDSAKVSRLEFRGFEAGYRKSAATTGERLYYDRKKPFVRQIPFYASYIPTHAVDIPRAYVVPRGQWHVRELLDLNDIRYSVMEKDSVMAVEVYRIADYKTSGAAYEGHYPHRETSAVKSVQTLIFQPGDIVVPCDQPGGRYLLEALEPAAQDSFFNWNFFDTVLQQKEHYSDYVFEDLAAKLLIERPELKAGLERKMAADTKFAASPQAQLEWIYKNSEYYEASHLRYPIYRIPKG